MTDDHGRTIEVSDVGFDIAVRSTDTAYFPEDGGEPRTDGQFFEGWVYFKTEIVYSLTVEASEYPDGLGDFANHIGVRFAKRLKEVLAPVLTAAAINCPRCGSPAESPDATCGLCGHRADSTRCNECREPLGPDDEGPYHPYCTY